MSFTIVNLAVSKIALAFMMEVKQRLAVRNNDEIRGYGTYISINVLSLLRFALGPFTWKFLGD